MMKSANYAGETTKNRHPNPLHNYSSLYFYKTKMCPFMLMGKCTKGANCTFAHSEQELLIQPNLKKTKLCNLYLHGQCPNREHCTFAHGKNELRSPPDFYKTSFCYPFMNGKTCFYGDKCRFAHGMNELRSKQQIKSTQEFAQVDKISQITQHSHDSLGHLLLNAQPHEQNTQPRIGAKLSKMLQFISLEEKLKQVTESQSTNWQDSSSNFDNFFMLSQNASNEKHMSEMARMEEKNANYAHFSLEGFQYFSHKW